MNWIGMAIAFLFGGAVFVILLFVIACRAVKSHMDEEG